jgi:hypothetical protein
MSSSNISSVTKTADAAAISGRTRVVASTTRAPVRGPRFP